jgi:signal transduction histidine kinase
VSDRPVRVLNVNDREVPRYVNEETLRRGGFEVVSADSGASALVAARQDVDVVLLDVQLPDLDGFEVCRRLKADPATANLIVLLTSATFVAATNKVAGLDSGADGYLVQPYEAAELFATLRSLLRARAAERRAQALAQELREAMAVRDEFLAMLGHELRNPIGTMTTALHLMSQPETGADPQRFLAILNRQMRSLTRIVDDLLDVARITRGKVALARDRLDLREVARQCVMALADDIRAAGHQVSLELAAAEVPIVGDPVRLEQVTNNLVTNAIKYTPRGGHLAVRVAADGERARLEVEDDGIGMEPAMRDRAFDLFVQGAQSLDRSRGGLGLGLTVVKQLVELHGGKVAVDSGGTNRGSRFVVSLPLAPVEVAPAAVEAEPVVTASPVHVVIVEDNDDAREALEAALTRLGHRVEVAGDGVAGLELALAVQPDVVLVDIGLPRLDGYGVARALRERGGGARPYLVAMTGYGQPEDRQRAERAGFDSHMVKPVSLDRLQRVLGRLGGEGGEGGERTRAG